MGAGNPKVCSFDDDKFMPKTFFVDFRSDDTVQYIKDHKEDTGHDISENIAECMLDESAWEDFDSMLYEIKELDFFGMDGKRHDELSANFRGDGIMYAGTENGMIVVTSESESNHIAFGFIPNKKYDEVLDDVIDEQYHKQDLYNARELDFDERCEKLAEIKYKKLLKTVKKEAKQVASLIAAIFSNEGFKKFFRVRNGAWVTSEIDKKYFITNF